jgi:asparagine synthase (glutamine-hydrolysing)
MPGIVGLISQEPANRCRAIVKAMLTTLDREEFYCSGTQFVPDLGFYAGWVAHDNSFAAGQPFRSGDGNVIILLSGECFADAAPSGSGDSSGADRNTGGWMADLYEEFGAQMFERLNGTFSGLLIDKREGKVILFNDRYGTERVYWHQAPDAFYFASEAKALLRVLPQLREFDEEGVAQFLTFGCAVNWRTLFHGIEILPGGSRWSFQNGACRRERYFDSQTWEALPSLSPESFQERFDETFKRILPRHFHTDSNLGIALTGGLDTRMILACEPDEIRKPVSYTFTGENGETFDDRVAAEVAEACGLEHEILRLRRDFFTNFPAHADETVYVTDGCFGITGTHEIYLNRQARQLSPIRLTGLFGSEVLRGVSYSKPIRPTPLLLDADFEKVLDASMRAFAAEQTHSVTSAAFRTIPWNLFGSMAASRSQVILRTPYLDNELVALAYQTPPNLQKSPQAALQLIRDNNPVLSRIPTDRLIEDKGAPFPRNLKWLLRETGFKLDYYHNEGMPHWFSRFDPILDLVDRRVRIFGQHKFLHYRSWFRKELAPYVLEVLTDRRTKGLGFFNRGFLDHMAKAHTQGYGNYVLSINAVLTLEAVERLLFRDLPTANTVEDLRQSPAAVSS